MSFWQVTLYLLDGFKLTLLFVCADACICAAARTCGLVLLHEPVPAG